MYRSTSRPRMLIIIEDMEEVAPGHDAPYLSIVLISGPDVRGAGPTRA